MSRRKQFKKKLEQLVKDETGNISKETVIKISLGTISALGVWASISSVGQAASPGTYVNHNNSIGDLAACVRHTNHSSY